MDGDAGIVTAYCAVKAGRDRDRGEEPLALLLP